MNIVEFKNRTYPFRELCLKGNSNVLVGTISLNCSLMNEDGTYSSCEAKEIDEEFFYFVEDNHITLNTEILSQIILEEL